MRQLLMLTNAIAAIDEILGHLAALMRAIVGPLMNDILAWIVR